MDCFCDCPTGDADVWLMLISFGVGCVFMGLVWLGRWAILNC